MGEIKITRKELYDLVWSQPMLALSQKYVISNVGLRKICIRMRIPLPKAGHWERLRAGRKTEKFKLSPNYTGENEITLALRDENYPAVSKDYAVTLLQKELEADPDKIVVAHRLTTTDKRITSAQECMTTKNRYTRHGLVGSGRGQLDVRVAPANVSRALRFMDALFKWLESRGHKISVGDVETKVIIGKQGMKILLRERTKKGGQTSWGSPENIPTGELYFKLDGYPGREWKDGRRTLEEQLPAIIARLEVQGKELLDEQIEWAKSRAEQAEKDRIRRERKERKEKELNDFKLLLQDAARWQKVTLLRSYIDSVEIIASKNNPVPKEIASWLKWAREKLDWYDPSIAKKDELLNDVDKETLSFNYKSSYDW